MKLKCKLQRIQHVSTDENKKFCEQEEMGGGGGKSAAIPVL